MSRDPRATARARFALAARAGTEGEKAAALNRGMAIVERYKLDPAQFDIPGRVRETIPPRPFLKTAMNAELANAILAEMLEAMLNPNMTAGGYSANLGGFNCAGEYRRRETATQKAEREREERMSDFVNGRAGNIFLDGVELDAKVVDFTVTNNIRPKGGAK